MKTRFLMSACFTTLTAGAALGASFDCKKATTPVELLVCSSPDLSQLDDQLSVDYRRARQAAASDAVRASLLQGQRDWVKQRNTICHDAQCLMLTYQQRIRDLTPGTSQAPAASVAAASPSTATPSQRQVALPSSAPTDGVAIVSSAASDDPDVAKVEARPCLKFSAGDVLGYAVAVDLKYQGGGAVDMLGFSYEDRTRPVIDAYKQRAESCLSGQFTKTPDRLMKFLGKVTAAEATAMQARADKVLAMASTFTTLASEADTAQTDLPLDKRQHLKPPFALTFTGAPSQEIHSALAKSPEWRTWEAAMHAATAQHDTLAHERLERDRQAQQQRQMQREAEIAAQRDAQAKAEQDAEVKLQAIYKVDFDKVKQNIVADGCGTRILDSTMYLDDSGQAFLTPRALFAVVEMAESRSEVRCVDGLGGRGFTIKVPGRESINIVFRRDGEELHLLGAGRGDDLSQLTENGKAAMAVELQNQTLAWQGQAVQNVAKAHNLQQPS